MAEIEVPDNLRGELVKKIEEKKSKLIESLMDLALGTLFVEPQDNPNRGRMGKIYQKLPDKEALMYLLNQVIGKPKEQMKISAGSGPIEFVFRGDEEVDESLEENQNENSDSIHAEEVGSAAPLDEEKT